MRRRSFAAPLVMVVACAAPRGPAAPAPDEPIERAPDPIVAASPVDPPAPVPPPVPTPAQMCQNPYEAFRRWGVRCSVPAWKGPPPPRQVISNPPPPLALDVVAAVAEGDAVLLTLRGGLGDGAQAGQRGVLRDADDRPIPGSAFVLIDVDRFTAHARVKLAPAAIPPDAYAFVRRW